MSESISVLHDTLEALIADRIACRREWADNVFGGGERGEEWFNAASPIVYVSELRDILDGKGFKPSESSAVTIGKVAARYKSEQSERESAQKRSKSTKVGMREQI